MLTSNEQIIELLLECTLFQGMSYNEISEALKGHLGRVKHHSSGSLIAQAGEELRSLNILLKGSVKGEMIDYTGKVIKIEDIAPPRPLAPIPRDRFLQILRENEKVLVNFINIVSNRGQFLSSKIKFLSFTTIKGKLAQYLLDLSGQSASGKLVLPHSQSQLAELFGVARPSIGRAIGSLNQDGIIRTRGKIVEILDRYRTARSEGEEDAR